MLGSFILYENVVDEDRVGILVEIFFFIMNRVGIKIEKVMFFIKCVMFVFKIGVFDFDFFSLSWLFKDEFVGDFIFLDFIIDIIEYFIILFENYS